VWLPFVARSGPLADVAAVCESARGSRGGLVLITGEPGVGKSRLAEEAAGAAERFRVVRTWCPAGGALGPWSRVVRELAADAGDVVRGSAGLSELVTGLGTVHADPGLERWRLSVDLAELFAAASSVLPLLVVIDDLHDADPSSARLLLELAPALRSLHAVVLATARDDWRGRADVWGGLNRLGRTIRLSPFTEADIGELVRAPAGDPAPWTILARTGGNPLLVTELVRSLAEGDEPGRVVPGSVQAIAAARLASLPEPAARLVSAGAVLGTRFRLDAAAAMAAGPAGELGTLVTQASDAGLFGEAAPGDGRFRHDLIRDALYAAMPADERMRLHERAAATLTGAAEVAHHLLRAGSGSLRPAAEVACRAGGEALQRLAFEDAVRWYEQAEACLAALDARDDERAELDLALGEARLAAGDREGARHALLSGAARAKALARPDLLARAALALSAGPIGFEVELLDRDQIDLLEQARAALPADEAALVTARLSVALTLIDSPDRRRELAETAVTAARRADDDAAVAVSLAALCDALAGPDHCEARGDYAGEIVAIARLLGNQPLELLGRRLRLVALLETGAIAGAEAEVLAYRTLAEVVRHPLYRWYVPLWQGMRALLDGRFDDCRAALVEAAALGEQAGSTNAAMLVATQRWCLCAEAGDRDGLTALLTELDELGLAGVWPEITRGLLLAQVGRDEDARAQLDATAPLLAAMPLDSEWLPAMAQVAETIGLIGAHPIAGWVYDALTPYAELFTVEGIGAAVRGPVHGALGLLAAATGDVVAADKHFAAGARAARSFGAPRLARRAETTVPAADPVFRRDGEYWTIRYGLVESRLRDSKGLRDLKVLLVRPGTAVAALDLLIPPGSGNGTEPDLHAPSDTGEVLDATARAAYRKRLRELESDAEEADRDGDAERGARVALERDALLAQLTAAYGLGGRVRRTGSAAERARTAVTARIRDAIRRIGRDDPALAEHLTRSVRTGTFCQYDPAAPTRWTG
jgi:hypothetical protein